MTGRDVTLTGASGNRLVGTHHRGGAPGVLLLHGGGQTRHAFDTVARRIAEAGHGAVTVDQRGHGDSDWVADARYGFADFGADVLALVPQLESLMGGPIIACGASLGGLASLIASGRKPGLFAGVILVDVTPWMRPDGVDKIEGFMREKAREGFATVEEAAEAIARYLPHRPPPRSLAGLRKNLRLHPDGRWRWHWDPRFFEGPHSVTGDLAGTEEAAAAGARSLRGPALLVRGQASELIDPAHVEAYRAVVPQVEVAEISGARHMVAGDRNTAFSGAILSFLARHWPFVRERAVQA